MSDSVIFEQLSTQLNFLLLSQRQMILISAFSVALMTFSDSMKQRDAKGAYFIYLAVVLLVYAIAVGSKASSDFNSYISDLDAITDPDELDMISRASSWVYFSYALLGVLATVLLLVCLVIVK